MKRPFAGLKRALFGTAASRSGQGVPSSQETAPVFVVKRLVEHAAVAITSAELARSRRHAARAERARARTFVAKGRERAVALARAVRAARDERAVGAKRRERAVARAVRVVFGELPQRRFGVVDGAGGDARRAYRLVHGRLSVTATQAAATEPGWPST